MAGTKPDQTVFVPLDDPLFAELAPLMPGAQGVVYDTALPGVHRQRLMRELGWLSANRVSAAAGSRKQGNSTARPIDERCTRNAMRALARRVQHLEAEIADPDAAMKTLIDRAAPQLIAERGVGYVTAATFYLAWSHPGRCHSEAAYARLGGTAPVEVTSGQSQDRHRLNRGGDRQLNRALYFVAVTRQRCCPVTKDYMARRTSEGKT
ncbi:MAG TPA: IS110 family transposase, partial [Ilumatobacter sp.]|nr:IS110 family transposase [Ilumatobacter sp.]